MFETMFAKNKSLPILVIVFTALRRSWQEEERRNSDATEDYCTYDKFQPRCPKSEVILMKSAAYGRMRVGRCITAKEVAGLGPILGQDPRYLGCSADVLEILDQKCSGLTECEVHLSDISVENIQPCFPGLIVYLEVSYDCLSAVDEKRSCAVSVSLNPITIIGSFDSQRICGTKSQPWIIEAPIGQKIRIHIVDLQTSRSIGTQGNTNKPCNSYGVIVDKAGGRNMSICGRGTQRETELYSSIGNTVTVYFNAADPRAISDNAKHFFLRVQAIGCSDIIPPEDSWLKRNDDSIVIGCYSSRRTWHLRCEGEKWIGVLGNCSQGINPSDATSAKKTEFWTDEQVLVTVAIGGFTFVSCLAILCLMIVCWRRISAQRQKNQDYRTLNYRINSPGIQPVNQSISSDATIGLTASTIRGFGAQQQLPTYSVYVGESQ